MVIAAAHLSLKEKVIQLTIQKVLLKMHLNKEIIEELKLGFNFNDLFVLM